MKSITTSIFFLTFSIFGAFGVFQDCKVSPTPDENGDIRVPQGDSVTVGCRDLSTSTEMTCILKFVNNNSQKEACFEVNQGKTLCDGDIIKETLLSGITSGDGFKSCVFDIEYANIAHNGVWTLKTVTSDYGYQEVSSYCLKS